MKPDEVEDDKKDGGDTNSSKIDIRGGVLDNVAMVLDPAFPEWKEQNFEHKSIYQVGWILLIKMSVLCTSWILSKFKLARDGDIQGIESLFRRISPEPKTSRIIKKINTLDENRVGILHYAARYEHLTMVKLIVHWGGDVNIRGDDGLTPLHFAAK